MSSFHTRGTTWTRIRPTLRSWFACRGRSAVEAGCPTLRHSPPPFPRQPSALEHVFREAQARARTGFMDSGCQTEKELTHTESLGASPTRQKGLLCCCELTSIILPPPPARVQI